MDIPLNDTSHSCRGCTLAHVEFKLPAAAVGGNAPKLEHAGFGHVAFERNRHDFFTRAICVRREKDFDWRQLFEIVADLFDQRAWRVVSPRERRKETELGGFADDEGELALRQFHFGAFFEAERNDRKSLHRRGEAGNSGQRGFDSDVIAARHATADADPFARPGESVISSSMSDGVHKIKLLRLVLQLNQRRSAGLLQPSIQNLEYAMLDCAGLQHAAVQEQMRGPGEPFRAGVCSCLAKKLSQVLGDCRIGGIVEANFYESGPALPLWSGIGSHGGEEAFNQKI